VNFHHNSSSNASKHGFSVPQVGGMWYSLPKQGMCAGAHRPLDGSGCSWRLAERKSVVNATCVYSRIDATVENHNETCFDHCPKPLNKTSHCYDACYSTSVLNMTADSLTRPWKTAFKPEAKGGCPRVSANHTVRSPRLPSRQ
jgi:hypothetical protein